MLLQGEERAAEILDNYARAAAIHAPGEIEVYKMISARRFLSYAHVEFEGWEFERALQGAKTHQAKLKTSQNNWWDTTVMTNVVGGMYLNRGYPWDALPWFERALQMAQNRFHYEAYEARSGMRLASTLLAGDQPSVDTAETDGLRNRTRRGRYTSLPTFARPFSTEWAEYQEYLMTIFKARSAAGADEERAETLSVRVSTTSSGIW